MRRKQWIGFGLAMLLAGTAKAQTPNGVYPAPRQMGEGVVQNSRPVVVLYQNGGQPMPAAPADPKQQVIVTPVEQPAAEEPALGPTMPEDIGWFNDLFGGTRLYGWADGGVTFSSSGHGIMATETRENRFGNEALINQLAVVFDKPLNPDCLDFGFNMTYYAGADASLLQPKGGIDDPPSNTRFSHDFRQLYASAHLPILVDGGVDVKVGRMGTIIGYEGALAPYRPFYSNDYQWFYAEDGAFTGFLTDWHFSKQLDVYAGMTLGANTFYTKRSEHSFCYISQINYWLEEDKKNLLSASLYTGPDAIFAAPGLGGNWDTTVEFRIQNNWSRYFTTILQSDDGWDNNVPGIGTAQWYSVYGIGIYHMTCALDLNLRGEWFDDVDGTRTGVSTAYEEATIGLDYHPQKWVSLRPEVRGDFSGEAAFGTGAVPTHRSQLTVACDLLLKY